MIVKTGRFGEIKISQEELIHVPQGLLGFPGLTEYCLVDPGDDTLILWLQPLQEPGICFPILEPKIFKPDYTAKLSGVELKELQLENINQSAVFSILTIPSNISEMTANLKAPVVINLKAQVAKQVILQENEYAIKHAMFKELRTHLITIQSQRRMSRVGLEDGKEPPAIPVSIRDIPPSLTVKSLNP